MRRNWDAIRAVLLGVAAGEMSAEYAPGSGNQVVKAHLCMLYEGGFVRSDGEGGVSITHAGHDLLDAIRDDRVWDVCRRAIALNAGGLPTALLLSVAHGAIREFAHDGRDCACEPGVCRHNRACPRLTRFSGRS